MADNTLTEFQRAVLEMFLTSHSPSARLTARQTSNVG